MTFTALDAINETYRHLVSGQRDMINVLHGAIDNVTTTIKVTDELAGIQAGSTVAIDLEVLYVRSTSPTAKTATVIRSWLGSNAGTGHADGTPVYVNPKFTGWDIFQALNVEINDLCSPGVGMFAVGETEFIYSPAIRGYDLGVPRDQVQGILELRYQTQDQTKAWPRLRRYSVMWDTDTSDFPSGTAIRLDEPAWPGRPIRVKYSKPYVMMTGPTSDLVVDCLLPATALDIPPLGAAAMLMFHKEAKRSFLESQGDTRRAAEVPPGSSTHDAAALLALRNQRAVAEAARISNNYPNYIVR